MTCDRYQTRVFGFNGGYQRCVYMLQYCRTSRLNNNNNIISLIRNRRPGSKESSLTRRRRSLESATTIYIFYPMWPGTHVPHGTTIYNIILYNNNMNV